MESTKQEPIQHSEVGLKELIQAFWRAKWLTLSLVVAFTVVAGVAAWLTPKTYKAAIIVSPVQDAPGSSSGLGGLGSLASQFGGLAALAGIAVSGDTKRSESLAILQSQALTEKYIQNNNLLPVLYAKKWDPVGKKWKEADPKKVPTLWTANEFFKKKVRGVTTDNKTRLVTVTITWRNADTAAKWANDLVNMTNDYMRNKAIAESERNIAYLNEQARRTDMVGVKQAIYTILQTEINKAMLARGSDEYALKVIDPAVPPEKPASPQPVIWVLMGMFAGVMISLFVTFIRLAWNAN